MSIFPHSPVRKQYWYKWINVASSKACEQYYNEINPFVARLLAITSNSNLKISLHHEIVLFYPQSLNYADGDHGF